MFGYLCVNVDLIVHDLNLFMAVIVSENNCAFYSVQYLCLYDSGFGFVFFWIYS